MCSLGTTNGSCCCCCFVWRHGRLCLTSDQKSIQLLCPSGFWTVKSVRYYRQEGSDTPGRESDILSNGRAAKRQMAGGNSLCFLNNLIAKTVFPGMINSNMAANLPWTPEDTRTPDTHFIRRQMSRRLLVPVPALSMPEMLSHGRCLSGPFIKTYGESAKIGTNCWLMWGWLRKIQRVFQQLGRSQGLR